MKSFWPLMSIFIMAMLVAWLISGLTHAPMPRRPLQEDAYVYEVIGKDFRLIQVFHDVEVIYFFDTIKIRKPAEGRPDFITAAEYPSLSQKDAPLRFVVTAQPLDSAALKQAEPEF